VSESKDRVCYLMVKDIPAPEGEIGLEFGADFNLDEGEELPEDIEQLSEAQFTVFKFLSMLRGTFAEAEIQEIMGEKGTGLVVPDR